MPTIKTIHRILHVSLPFSESAIIGANKAVSEVRGVDIGDGKKYKFLGLRNFKNEYQKDGCKMKRTNEKGRKVSYKRKDAHYHQSFDIDLEEITTSPQPNLDDKK